MSTRALATISIAALLDLAAGVVFALVEHVTIWVGLYWAAATATTVGYGDVTPRTTTGHVVAVLVMLTVIPLFAAAFSLVTSGLTAIHVHDEGQRVRDRIEHVIKHHPGIPDFMELQ